MPDRQAAGDLWVARSSFATVLNGEQLMITVGTLVDGNDPVLQRRRHLFRPAAELARSYPGQVRAAVAEPPVEQATAAPGEKRTIKR